MMTTSNGYATRDIFLTPATRRIKEIIVPGRNLKMRIRSLLEGEKESYEASLVTAKAEYTRETLLNARRRLVALCLCDENGNRILQDADIDAMKQLDGAELAYLQEQCQQHVGFKAGDIEGMVKNSENVHADS